MNRAERRAAARSKEARDLRAYAAMSNAQREAAFAKNGITRKEYNRAVLRTSYEARVDAVRAVYAAALMTLAEKFGFGKVRLERFMHELDHKVINTINSDEAVEETFQKYGVRIEADYDPMAYDRIEMQVEAYEHGGK